MCWFEIIEFTVSDYYQFDDLLTAEEQDVRKRVRECMEKEVAPIMTKVVIILSPNFATKCFSVLFTFQTLLLIFCQFVYYVLFFHQCVKLVIKKESCLLILLHINSDLLALLITCLVFNCQVNLLFQYWEKAEFPFEVIPKLGALRIAGGSIKVLWKWHVLYSFSNDGYEDGASLVSNCI